MGRVKIAVAVVFICLFAVFSIAVKTELRRETSPLGAIKVDEPMPDFSFNENLLSAIALLIIANVVFRRREIRVR